MQTSENNLNLGKLMFGIVHTHMITFGPFGSAAIEGERPARRGKKHLRSIAWNRKNHTLGNWHFARHPNGVQNRMKTSAWHSSVRLKRV